MTSKQQIVPVILSGGSGTRLWPLSRAMRPKQFINLVGDDSLFQQTLTRLAGIDGMADPVVVCNEEHRFLVAEQLQALGIDRRTIILEPVARNTGPAIAIAAAQLSADGDPQNDLMLVLPADHLIHDIPAFIDAVELARETAEEGTLITFGIAPDRPATGYGYLKAAEKESLGGIAAVEKFIEKPDLSSAESYLADGNYYWNSGMFMFTPEICLQEFDRHCPEVTAHATAALAAATEDLDFLRLDKPAYEQCPNISVDYAVMERSDRVKVVPLDVGWSDVGSWTSLWESGEKDSNGNVTQGDVLLESVNNSYIHSENKLVAALGVDDLIIVETHDGLLVTSKQHDQDIKIVVERLKQLGRPEVELHRKAFRPWGNYDCLDDGDRFQVKRIMVKSGEQISMQKHFHRAEHWIVVSGTAEVTCGDKTFMLSENEAAYIPLGEKHRLKNPGKLPLEIIEVQSGSYLGEDDIVRFDDQYGRS
ncbi:MAG: mannose-1-phosphate guanylyltransferase/mannose-6-phosphate isomerase [Arenicellales bacterium]